MSRRTDQCASEEAAFLDEIRKVFGDVQRGDGVTLHETEVIDMYGSQDARRQARGLDADCHWWEVRDEWIEQFGGVGGLSFLDDAGFHYYLPAYMSYWLRIGDEPNNLAFHLTDPKFRDFEKIFRPAEKKIIARFLVQVGGQTARKALESYWGRYLEEPNET